jgi:hypothetical protein
MAIGDQPKLYAQFFSEALDAIKNANNQGIVNARETDEYTALVQLLIKVHQDEQGTIESTQLADLKAIELKSRLELLRTYRSSKTPPSGMKQTTLINEYIAMLHANFGGFTVVRFKDVEGKMVVDVRTKDTGEEKSAELTTNAILTKLVERMTALETKQSRGPPLPMQGVGQQP